MLDADVAGGRPRIVELGARVHTVRLGQQVDHEEGDQRHEEDDEATHFVTTLSAALIWYSELGQVEMYLD